MTIDEADEGKRALVGSLVFGGPRLEEMSWKASQKAGQLSRAL